MEDKVLLVQLVDKEQSRALEVVRTINTRVIMGVEMAITEDNMVIIFKA